MLAEKAVRWGGGAKKKNEAHVAVARTKKSGASQAMHTSQQFSLFLPDKVDIMAVLSIFT